MPAAPVLSGELGLLSLFDLGQLFMLNRASGELSIVSEGRKGYFYFDQGQIVNAVDDEYHEGEGAAYVLFGWKTGTFTFVAGSASGAHTITENTEGLMMEAARRMDELGAGESGGEVDRLARRASSLDALRQAFQSVATQTRPLPSSDDPDATPFELLRDPSDALLFRPGELARARLAGVWRGAGAQPVDRGAFEQLRAKLLEGYAGERPVADAAGVTTWSVEHEDGRTYTVTSVSGENEALWLRAAALAPPELAGFEGRHDQLRECLAESAGLLIVSGPEAATTERLFHACIAQLARQRAGAVLLATDHGRWRHEDGTGVIVRASGPRTAEMVEAMSPDVAAFDAPHAGASLAAIGSATRVVVAVPAHESAHALARWCARVGRRSGDGIEALLADLPLTVLHVVPRANALPAFTVVPVRTSAPAVAPAAAAASAAPEPVAHAEESAPAPAPKSTASTADPMAALAAELTRTLKKGRKAA